MKYHGNYCGPNWSDGKQQPSVVGSLLPIDDFDLTCQKHDAVYATSTEPEDLQRADREFVRANWGKGPQRHLAALAVGAQMMVRSLDIMTKKHKQTDTEKKILNHWNTMVKNNMLKLPTPMPAQPARKRMEDVPKMKKEALPAAYMVTSRTGNPKTKLSKDGNVVLKHRGLISGFTGSTTFTATNFQINPGLGATFPWASQLARSYDKYRFRKLSFEYRSVVATTTPGVVMMSFDYDTLDSIPASKFEHSQTTPNVEGNAFNSFVLRVECDNTYRFVRQGAIASGDLKTYDFGQLVVSSSYGTAALCGEVYVDYEVELSKPSHGVPITVKASTSSASYYVVPGSTFSGTASPCTCVVANQLKFTRPGEYLISTTVLGSSLVLATAPSLVAGYSAGAAIVAVDGTSTVGGASALTSNYKCRVGAGDSVTFDSLVSGIKSATFISVVEGEYSIL